jgi:hypothetical protein
MGWTLWLCKNFSGRLSDLEIPHLQFYSDGEWFLRINCAWIVNELRTRASCIWLRPTDASEVTFASKVRLGAVKTISEALLGDLIVQSSSASALKPRRTIMTAKMMPTIGVACILSRINFGFNGECSVNLQFRPLILSPENQWLWLQCKRRDTWR